MLLALGTRTERVAENVIRDGVAGLPTSTQWVTGGLALDNCIFAAWHWKRHGWRCARTWTERFTASVRVSIKTIFKDSLRMVGYLEIHRQNRIRTSLKVFERDVSYSSKPFFPFNLFGHGFRLRKENLFICNT